MRRAPADAPADIAIERIYVSWTESWDVARYAAHYLRERGAAPDRGLHAAVIRLIFRYPGDPPSTASSTCRAPPCLPAP